MISFHLQSAFLSRSSNLCWAECQRCTLRQCIDIHILLILSNPYLAISRKICKVECSQFLTGRHHSSHHSRSQRVLMMNVLQGIIQLLTGRLGGGQRAFSHLYAMRMVNNLTGEIRSLHQDTTMYQVKMMVKVVMMKLMMMMMMMMISVLMMTMRMTIVRKRSEG